MLVTSLSNLVLTQAPSTDIGYGTLSNAFGPLAAILIVAIGFLWRSIIAKDKQILELAVKNIPLTTQMIALVEELAEVARQSTERTMTRQEASKLINAINRLDRMSKS